MSSILNVQADSRNYYGILLGTGTSVDYRQESGFRILFGLVTHTQLITSRPLAKELVNLIVKVIGIAYFDTQRQCTTSSHQAQLSGITILNINNDIVEVEVRRLRSAQVLSDDTQVIKFLITTLEARITWCFGNSNCRLTIIKARSINLGIALYSN